MVVIQELIKNLKNQKSVFLLHQRSFGNSQLNPFFSSFFQNVTLVSCDAILAPELGTSIPLSALLGVSDRIRGRHLVRLSCVLSWLLTSSRQHRTPNNTARFEQKIVLFYGKDNDFTLPSWRDRLKWIIGELYCCKEFNNSMSGASIAISC